MKTTTLTGGTTYRYSIFASLGNTNTNGTSDNSSTYRLIPATLSTSTIDPIGRLDVGYHYNGSVVYTTDVFGDISFVYSGETVFMRESNTNFIGNDVVSGTWNSNTLIDQSMVLYGNASSYHYNNSTTNYNGCGYHVPNTPINNQLVTGMVYGLPVTKSYPCIASLAVSPFDNTIVGGVVYTDQDSTSAYYTSHLRIYKYVSDTGGWALLGLYDIISTQTGMQDLALSVGQDSNVWATWGFTTELYAARVSLSASSANLNASNSNLLIPNWNGAAAAGGHAISMSYDPQALDTIGSDTCYGVRLAFLNDLNSTGTTILRESPLLFNPRLGQIVFEYPNGQPVTEPGQSAEANVRLVYNPNYTGSAPAFQDFSSALEGGYLRAYDLSTPSSDIWTPDNTYGPSTIGSGAGETDLTYRSTGQKLTVWQTSGSGTLLYLTTNQGGAVTLFNSNDINTIIGHPRITTNAFNRRDPALLWDDSYDLEQDGTPIAALFVRELYP